MSPVSFVARPLSPDAWDDFARLVEANNGVWGGCWCMGFHPEGVGKGHTATQNRDAKQAHVRNGTVHQILVYDGDDCVGWCQYGPPVQLPNILNPKAYAKEPGETPDWRIGCIFTGRGHRRHGVARAGLGAALAAIKEAGGGLVEAYPEQVEGRDPRARCLLPYRADQPVRGVRLRARPQDSEVALGDAAAHSALNELHRSLAATALGDAPRHDPGQAASVHHDRVRHLQVGRPRTQPRRRSGPLGLRRGVDGVADEHEPHRPVPGSRLG